MAAKKKNSKKNATPKVHDLTVAKKAGGAKGGLGLGGGTPDVTKLRAWDGDYGWDGIGIS